VVKVYFKEKGKETTLGRDVASKKYIFLQEGKKKKMF